MSFSWIVVDALRKLGVRVDDREAEDYPYRWRVIGEMLGIQPAAIPTDLARAAELTELIAERNHPRSEEGIEMTRALFDLHANTLPRGVAGADAIPAGGSRRGTGRASAVFPSSDPELVHIAQAQPA